MSADAEQAVLDVAAPLASFGEEVPTASGELLDGVRSLDEAGALPQAMLGPMTRYMDLPPHQRPSMQSESWMQTETQHLLRQPVHVTLRNDAGFITDTMIQGASDVTFYHGTTAWAAHRIIRGGGFIPGLNGHTKNRRYYRGCFGSTFFDVAHFRGDPTRHLADDLIYTLLHT